MTRTGRRHAALLLTAGGAAALLTACGTTVQGTTARGTTSAMPSTAAAAPATTATTAGTAAAVGMLTTASATTSSCAPRPQNDRVVRVSAVESVGAAPYAVVSATTFVCGPNIVGEGYYKPTGTPYKLAFAASARVLLSDDFTRPTHTSPATLALLEQLVRTQSTVDGKWSWYGGIFGVNLDSQGHVTEIDEYYHP